jgi:hypothetical protein
LQKIVEELELTEFRNEEEGSDDREQRGSIDSDLHEGEEQQQTPDHQSRVNRPFLISTEREGPNHQARSGFQGSSTEMLNSHSETQNVPQVINREPSSLQGLNINLPRRLNFLAHLMEEDDQPAAPPSLRGINRQTQVLNAHASLGNEIISQD